MDIVNYRKKQRIAHVSFYTSMHFLQNNRFISEKLYLLLVFLDTFLRFCSPACLKFLKKVATHFNFITIPLFRGENGFSSSRFKRIEQPFLSSQHNSKGIVDSGKQYWISVIRGLASESEKAGNGEVAVTEARERTSTAPRRRRRGWWRGDRELLPFGFDDFFRPNAFGNALYEMADSLNRMVDDLSPLSTRYFGQLKEDDNSYRLRYEVPGLTKDDLNITLEDRNLVIRGEHKEEKRDETAGGDGFWSSSSYGYYNSRLQLPMDANVGDIKAELKHGILYLTIPKVESKGKEVKKIEIQ